MNKRCTGLLLTAVCVLLLGMPGNAQQSGPVGPPTVAPPVITGLYPASAKVGTKSLLVFATGQNFVPGLTTAQFKRSDGPVNGPARATVVFNSQVLAFELTAADLAQTETVMVDVVNRGQNQSVSVSNQVPFVVLP